jgi:CDP-glucose 4,6-dehydratase
MGDFWERRSVFVTGVTGLLGGWLVRGLIANGANVIALVRRTVPGGMFVRDGWLERTIPIYGDIGNEKLIGQALSKYSVDTVFHLAAQPLVEVAIADPIGTMETNVRGTWTVLEACRQAGVRQILVASSDKATGLSAQPGGRTQGQFPYAVSKACVDLITTMYAATYELPAITVHSGNLFGGGDRNCNRLIPGVIQATLRGEPFHIRGDGKSVRDFLYVEDAADAYLHLAERLSADSSLRGNSFYFGMEARLTVLELVERITRLMGRSDLRPVVQNAAARDIPEAPLSAGIACASSGWSARYGFDRGLERTIAWYRDSFALTATETARSCGA